MVSFSLLNSFVLFDYASISANCQRIFNGLEWTGIDWSGLRGKNFFFRGKNLELLYLIVKELLKYVGTSWEKLFFSWEKLFKNNISFNQKLNKINSSKLNSKKNQKNQKKYFKKYIVVPKHFIIFVPMNC